MLSKQKNIPVTIITGFLGAGKTTTILHLLKHKSRDEQWAVLINEFGKVAIDFETISPKATANEKVFEISGGCICCSAKDYFQQNLKQIIQEHNYDRILIEPSGLGGIDMISEIIRNEVKLKLMPVIGLVSIDYLGEERLQINPIFQNQLVKSDILVLCKCDFEPDPIKQEEALDRLKLKYPNKLAYSKIANGKLNYDCLLISKPIKKQQFTFDGFNRLQNGLEKDTYEALTFLFRAGQRFDLRTLADVLKKEERIIRTKGYVQSEKGWFFINYTLSNFFVEVCEQKPENKLVLITEKKGKHKTDENLRIKIDQLLSSSIISG